MEHARIGEKLEEFEPGEVRRLLIEPYEMRYEIQLADFVLRIWQPLCGLGGVLQLSSRFLDQENQCQF